MPIERLPTKVRPYAYRLREWMTTDAPPIILLGLMSITIGISYVVTTPDPPYHPIETVTFVGLFGVLWFCDGLLLLACVFYPRSKLAGLAVGGAVGLCYAWAGSLIAQFMFDEGHSIRHLSRAALYVAVGTLVLYIVWLKSVLVREESKPPSAEEVRDVLRGDAS